MDNQTSQNQPPVEPIAQTKQGFRFPFSKYLPLVVIAVIAAILGSAGTYLALNSKTKPQTIVTSSLAPTPTPDPTTNWKTYVNTQYGIEFKYPPTLSPINVADKSLIAAFTDKSNIKQRLSTSPDISLRTFTALPGEDYKNKLIEDVIFAGSGLHPKSFAEFSSKRIGDNNVYFIQTGIFEGILSINYYLINKDRVFAFDLVSNPVDWTNPNFKSENDPLNNDLRQILSTFKFTDQAISPSIKVLLPNGQETLKTGQTFDISWSSQDVKNVIIALFQVNSRVYLIGSKNGIDASLKKFQWEIDKDVPYAGRSDLKIALYDSAYCAYVDEVTGVECAKDENIHSDISDDYFSITSGN